MSAEHPVIFIPGLGEGKGTVEMIVKSWSIYGTHPHIHRIGWNDRQVNF